MARRTDTVTTPSGVVVPIQQLGWLQTRASRAKAAADARANLKIGMDAVGGAEGFAKAWAAMHPPQATPPPSAADVALVARVAEEGAAAVLSTPTLDPEPVDLLDGHDLLTVLIGGIPSYTREQVEDFDPTDAEYVGRAILALTTPPRTEEQEKNAPGSFTSA
jgi:hypothetical protein